MRLTIIGSGDAFGSGGRFNTCFRIETGGRAVLIDCGASSVVAMKAQGIDPNSIDGVIFSHLHGDHFGGVPFLLLDAQYMSRRERPLTLAGPPGTTARVKALLEASFPASSKTKWRFPLEVVDIPVGVPAGVLGLQVTNAEVIHFSGAPSTALRVHDGEKTLAYSGDTEWTDNLLPIAAGADLFIVECFEYARNLTGHLSWATVQARLADFGARRVMITHMNPSMLARLDEARAAGVLVAEDGAVLEL